MRSRKWRIQVLSHVVHVALQQTRKNKQSHKHMLYTLQVWCLKKASHACHAVAITDMMLSC
jgi:hypothetical protein